MRYCTSKLALIRKGLHMNQTDAATALGMKSKQHLCGIERGWRMASPAVMKKMQALYEQAHPNLGCGDIGCEAAHPEEE